VERDFRVPGFIAWGDSAAMLSQAYGTSVRSTSGQ
jgi:hypothetical protein